MGIGFPSVVAALRPGGALAQVFGRDFWPNDGQVTPDISTASLSIKDAIEIGGQIYVVYGVGKDLKVAPYNLTAGALTTASAAEVLAHDTATGSFDALGIHGANVELCLAEEATWVNLTHVAGTTYQAPNIGILPSSIVVRKMGGGVCPTVGPNPATFVDGVYDGSTYSYDQFDLINMGTCTAFQASYKYTNCSLDGTDAFHCEKDSDTATELGYCKHFLLYEGRAHLNVDSTVPDDRHLFLAHAQDIMGPWQKHLYGVDSFPGSDDIAIANRGPHEGSSTADVYSFAGVPDLIYDDPVWRMWFVAEDTSMAPLRYSESADDGLTWGIGANADQPIDCWDDSPGSYDTGHCKLIEWDSTAVPPDFSPTSKIPDAVDPTFAVVDYDGDNTAELLMFTTSVDEDCDSNSGSGDLAVFLVSAHEAMGDQSTGVKWVQLNNVYMDNTTGIILEEDTAVCEGDDADYTDGDDNVTDPTVVKYADGKWILFFQMRRGVHPSRIYVAASGFECSDFINNDSDSYIDYPPTFGDADCESPTDDME